MEAAALQRVACSFTVTVGMLQPFPPPLAPPLLSERPVMCRGPSGQSYKAPVPTLTLPLVLPLHLEG